MIITKDTNFIIMLTFSENVLISDKFEYPIYMSNFLDI